MIPAHVRRRSFACSLLRRRQHLAPPCRLGPRRPTQGMQAAGSVRQLVFEPGTVPARARRTLLLRLQLLLL